MLHSGGGVLTPSFQETPIPDSWNSGVGPQFMSHFWKRIFQTLGTSTKFSTAFHPETNGQIERVNQILEQYLRCMIS